MKIRRPLLILCILLIILLLTTNTFKAIYSIVQSKIIPLDTQYIIKEGEWSGENKGIISFYDHTDTLKHDTVFRQHKPIYKIKSLNKYFNEITVIDLRDNANDVFLSTRELTK